MDLPVQRACRLLGILLLLAGPIAHAQTAPAQQPLLSREGGGVKPNIMLTIDDSGSMRYQHMPETASMVGNTLVAPPVGNGSVVFHPDDTGTQSRYTTGTFGPTNYFQGVIAARANDSTADNTAWQQRYMRSPDTNTIFYNPEVRYRPWVRADGTRYPNAVFTAARLHPDDPAEGVIDLSVAGTALARWCFVPGAGGCAESTQTFAPGLYFRLGRDASGVYRPANQAASYTEFDVNTMASFPKGSERTDCAASTTCTQAEERQNFANWFVYHRSRLLMAKGAIAEALQPLDDSFRLGYGRINKRTQATVDGTPNLMVIERGVRDFGATAKNQVFTWLYGMPAADDTPLRRALQHVGRYYESAASEGPWGDTPGTASAATQKSCRRSYNILVTDGYWNDGDTTSGLTMIGNSDGTPGPAITGDGRSYQYVPGAPFIDARPNMLADFAMEYWKRDLRPDLPNRVVPTPGNPAFWQNMTNYTISIGLRGVLNPAADLPALQAGTLDWTDDRIDDLWHTAVNSRGQYYAARDPRELGNAVRSALTSTFERELQESGVATAATVLEADGRKYIPRYKTGAWTGDVEAYVLDTNGNTSAFPVWRAKDRMPAWDTRRIFTWDPDQATPRAVPFEWSAMSSQNRNALGPASHRRLVDFLRGDRSNEDVQDTTKYRAREHILGDFINTNPVYAKANYDPLHLRHPVHGASYSTFVNTTKTNRPGTLYVGGNDGMLHAFRETRGASPAEDGREIFAFVPRAVYPSLARLAERDYGRTGNYHAYFVDGPLREADVHVPPPNGGAAEWRNYLFGSTGAGARAVFAIDITDPANLGVDAVRWEMNASDYPNLGHVLFPIEAGPLRNGKWVAVFGNGYGSAFGRAALYVVELDTGTVHRVFATGPSPDNGLGGVSLLRDAQGYITALYAGDLRGDLWKFEYDAGAGPFFRVANGGRPLFRAGQPILQPPAIFEHSLGGQMIVFGTGRLITEADANTTSMQALYGVRDNPPESLSLPLERTDLVPRTISTVAGTGNAADQTFFSLTGSAIDWNTRRGWYTDLSVTGFSGLRSIYPPQKATSRYVLMSSVSPAQNIQPCENATGRGINFLFAVETGTVSAQPVFDTNGDGTINGQDQPVAGYSSSADGIDAILRGQRRPPPGGFSDPCLTLSIQNTTGQVRACVPDPNPLNPIRDRIWRRLLNPPVR